MDQHLQLEVKMRNMMNHKCRDPTQLLKQAI